MVSAGDLSFGHFGMLADMGHGYILISETSHISHMSFQVNLTDLRGSSETKTLWKMSFPMQSSPIITF